MQGPFNFRIEEVKKTFHENVIGEGNYLAQVLTQEQVDVILGR